MSENNPKSYGTKENIRKTFNWEGYNKDGKEYKFEDLTEEELEEWGNHFEHKIERTKKGIYLKGKHGHKMKWK